MRSEDEAGQEAREGDSYETGNRREGRWFKRLAREKEGRE